MSKKILISGINGMLGRAIYNLFRRLDGYELFGIGRSEQHLEDIEDYFQGDIADSTFIKQVSEKYNYDYIIQTAAIVNLKICEENEDYATQVHSTSNHVLASLNPNSVFYYISTDSVFDGSTGNFAEEDDVNPLNKYALTKYLGEKTTLEYSDKAYIFRLNIYGVKNPQGKSLFEWAFSSLKANKAINGYTNVIFNPLYVGQVAKILQQFIESEPDFGVYHIAGADVISKFDFLVEIAKYFDLDESLISPVEADYDTSFIKRPYNTSLNIDKLKKTFNHLDLTMANGFKALAKDLS